MIDRVARMLGDNHPDDENVCLKLSYKYGLYLSKPFKDPLENAFDYGQRISSQKIFTINE